MSRENDERMAVRDWRYMSDLDVIPMTGGKPMYYKLLDDHSITPASRREVGEMFSNEGSRARQVAYDEVDGSRVCTDFLAIDHDFSGLGPPVVFETMIFGDYDGWTRRYTTWDEALAGHQQVINDLRSGKEPA